MTVEQYYKENEAWIWYCTYSFYRTMGRPLNIALEEIHSQCLVAFVESVNSLDTSRSNIRTWSKLLMFQSVREYIDAELKYRDDKREVGLQYRREFYKQPPTALQGAIFNEAMEQAESRCNSDKKKSIFHILTSEFRDGGETGRIIGCTRERVRQIQNELFS